MRVLCARWGRFPERAKARTTYCLCWACGCAVRGGGAFQNGLKPEQRTACAGYERALCEAVFRSGLLRSCEAPPEQRPDCACPMGNGPAIWNRQGRGFLSILAGMHFLAASSPLDPAWWFLLVIGLHLWRWWEKRADDRKVIRKEAARWQARVLGIEWLPGHALGRRETAYRVALKLASGKRLNAVCRCSRYADLVWEGQPWWAEGPQPQPEPDEAEVPSLHDTVADDVAGTEAATGRALPAAESGRIVADCIRCGYGLLESSRACPNCGTEVVGD
jgi:hypothetical protein